MKKQHLRKLERDNESQTEVEKVERGRREIEDRGYFKRDRLSFGT